MQQDTFPCFHKIFNESMTIKKSLSALLICENSLPDRPISVTLKWRWYEAFQKCRVTYFHDQTVYSPLPKCSQNPIYAVWLKYIHGLTVLCFQKGKRDFQHVFLVLRFQFCIHFFSKFSARRFQISFYRHAYRNWKSVSRCDVMYPRNTTAATTTTSFLPWAKDIQ